MTLIWNQVGPAAREAIERAAPDVEVLDIPLDPEAAPGRPADVLFARPRPDLPRAALSSIDVSWADGVPWVHSLSVGIDQYPPGLLAERVVTVPRGVWSGAVAEYVLAAILSAEKRMPWIYSGAHVPLFTLGLLRDATVGIVGFGDIGQAVARLLAPLGSNVVATRRCGERSPLAGVSIVPLDRLFAQSDHIVLTVPTTSETIGLIGDSVLAEVKPGAHLINVARGSVVDDAALLRALDDGRLSAATLDVTEPEPLPDDHPLRQREAVRISPHVSGAARGLEHRAFEAFTDNVRRFLSREPLQGVADIDKGY
ncbi:NAD(P)-dependent oxidoreductase [Conexibacter sp. CPCC 206217]|uniref:NAD(P)-dependent oxidoreductase n=1 Tax=Conexibacter sp. CPCC 206217 TaxID=3064574 RepID=UPI00272034A1|nr:NAD(P)-dependent oxidoreductase [Conexibacter sp. CPCC 206217]MDO8212137.1 NAD(P)-dependent oxidoreductase [Conexibacter sp. CPCC 206217]